MFYFASDMHCLLHLLYTGRSCSRGEVPFLPHFLHPYSISGECVGRFSDCPDYFHNYSPNSTLIRRNTRISRHLNIPQLLRYSAYLVLSQFFTPVFRIGESMQGDFPIPQLLQGILGFQAIRTHNDRQHNLPSPLRYSAVVRIYRSQGTFLRSTAYQRQKV